MNLILELAQAFLQQLPYTLIMHGKLTKFFLSRGLWLFLPAFLFVGKST